MKPSLKLSQKYPKYYKGEISTPLQHLLSGVKKKNARKLKKHSISHLAICELHACNMRMVD